MGSNVTEVRWTDILDNGVEEFRKHKIPYGHILFHVAYGMLAILVIIKIVLAITFVFMLSTLTQMFAGIKYLLKFQEHKAAEPVHVEYVHPGYFHHDDHSSPEYGPPAAEYGAPHYKRRQDLHGARRLGGGEQGARKKRHTISERSGADDDCKRRAMCELHVRAKHSPFYAYQVYYLKRDQQSKYWDHNDNHTLQECKEKYPCHTKQQNEAKQVQVRASQEDVAPSETPRTFGSLFSGLTNEDYANREQGDYLDDETVEHHYSDGYQSQYPEYSNTYDSSYNY